MIRVLLADDQTLVRAGFRALLDAQGDIEVAGEASDGEQAVSLARRSGDRRRRRHESAGRSSGRQTLSDDDLQDSSLAVVPDVAGRIQARHLKTPEQRLFCTDLIVHFRDGQPFIRIGFSSEQNLSAPIDWGNI